MVKQMLMPYLDYSMHNVNDFKRVELNYIEIRTTGRNQRESVLYNDLEIKLLIDEEAALIKSRALETTKLR
jgi:hypothetical protein